MFFPVQKNVLYLMYVTETKTYCLTATEQHELYMG